MFKKIWLPLFILAVSAGVSFSAIPQFIGYEGRLTDSSGNPVTTSRNFTFRLYSQASGGAPVTNGTSTESLTPDSNGIFSAGIFFQSNAFDGTNRWLGIEIGTDGEMTPRTQIASAAHAYRALQSDDSTKAAGFTIAASGSNIIPTTDGTGKLSSSVLPAFVTGISSVGASALTGAVSLKGGTNVTLLQVGQTIEVFATGGGGSGTVTQVNTSRGLLGGPITTTGTLTIDTNVVVTTSDAQTLTNKTINGSLNTITNITAASANYAALAGTATSAGTANSANYASLSGTTSVAASTNYATLAGTASVTASTNYAALAGTATSAGTANSANYASLSGTTSVAASTNYSILSGTATSAGTAASANYATLAGTASVTASTNYSALSGTATSAGTASSANYASLSGTTSVAASTNYATLAGTASTAASADLATNSNYAILAGTASVTASTNYAILAGTASVTASTNYAALAGTATSAGTANSANYAALSGTTSVAASTNYAALAGTASVTASTNYATLSGTSTVATTAVLKTGDFMTGTLTVEPGNNIMVKNGSVIIGTTETDTANPETLLSDSGITGTKNVISGYGNTNNFVQLNIKNRNSGNNASSDLVATADNGDDFNNYVDLGINSSTNNDVNYTFSGPNGAYLYNKGQDFSIATGSPGKSIKFHTGDTLAENERMRIDGSGKVSIGTTEATSLLTVAGTIEMTSVSGGGVKFSDGTMLASGIMRASNMGTNSITQDAIAAGTPGPQQFLRWNGTALDWATPPGSTGSIEVDHITINHNINGSLEVIPGGLDASRYGTGSVTSSAIAANAITGSKIASGAIDGTKLDANINISTLGYITAESVSATNLYGNGAGISGISADTSKYAALAGTATTAVSANYAALASTATTAVSADYATLAGTVTTAASANFAILAGTATSAASTNYASLAGTASSAASADLASNADYSILSGTSTVATTAVLKAGDIMTGTLTLPASGLNVGAGELIDVGGNIGIGTTNPQGVLHVQGNNNGVSGESIKLYAGSGTSGGGIGGSILLNGGASLTPGAGGALVTISGGASGVGGGISMSTASGASGNGSFSFTAASGVGTGGGYSFTAGLGGSGTGGGMTFTTGVGTGGPGTRGGDFRITLGNGSTAADAGNFSVTGGNVGIGTMTPEAGVKLSVVGNVKIGSASIESSTGRYYGDGSTLTGVAATSANYSVLSGTASNAAYATLAGTASTAGTSISADFATLSGTATTATSSGYAALSGTSSTAANVTSTINISTSGYITAETFNGGDVNIPSGNNAYLGSDSTSGASTVTIPMIAASAITAGEVVVCDPTADNQVRRTTTTADQNVMGFAVNTTTGAGQTVYVAVAGRVTNAKANGTIHHGDAVQTCAPLGSIQAVSGEVTVGASIGVALTNDTGGMVTVWIQKF